MTTARTRGRPREYDETEALGAAGQVFWTKGFSATSLDDLAEAMGMNRPSIYRAFGNKEAVYRRALMQFCQQMEAAFAATMLAEEDIGRALTLFYEGAVATYTGGGQARGCMVMSTAVAAATSHPEIQSDLLGIVRDLDGKFAGRFRTAIADGQLPASFDAAARAAVAQALLHSLSLRARAGESPRELRRLIEAGVATLLS